ncbi:MAG TPA: hypothetical protein V6C85_14150 [Allocoleopsis sp.]
MNPQEIYSFLALLTLIGTPTIAKADNPSCSPISSSCEQSIATVYKTNYTNYIELVKGSGPEVFAIENGKRRWITDSKTFSTYGFRYSEVKQVFDREIDSYPEGQSISQNGTLLKGSTANVYIVLDGIRRQVSPQVFEKYQFRQEDVNFVNDSYLLSIPEGPAFP